MKIKKNNIYIFLVLLLSVLTETIFFAQFKYFVLLFATILISLYLFDNTYRSNGDRYVSEYFICKNNRTLILSIFTLFFSSIFLNRLIIFEDLIDIIEPIGFIIFFIFSVLFFIKAIHDNKISYIAKIIVYISFLLSCCCILFSLITFDFVRYKSIYDFFIFSSNASFFKDTPELGIFIGASLIFAYYLFLNNELKNSFFYLILFISFFAILISGNRTGFFASILALISYKIIIKNMKFISFKVFLKIFFFILFFVLILFILSEFFPYIKQIFRSANFISGRDYLWSFITLDNLSFFGHSKKYIANFFSYTIYDPLVWPYTLHGFHNYYINTLFFFGLIPFFILILIKIVEFLLIFNIRHNYFYLVQVLYIYTFIINILFSYSYGGGRFVSTLSAFIISLLFSKKLIAYDLKKN
ncbi:MAG: oligosaccharide repeat unit polymerase [Methylophilaceae bacterium]